MTQENSDTNVNTVEPNKLAAVVIVKFTYVEGGRWHSIDVSCAEWLEILRTGEVDGKKICALEVVTVNEDEDKVSFVYDFVSLAQGANPWRVV